MEYQYQDMMKRQSLNAENNKVQNGYQFVQSGMQPQTPVHQYGTGVGFLGNNAQRQRLGQFEQVPQTPNNQ